MIKSKFAVSGKLFWISLVFALINTPLAAQKKSLSEDFRKESKAATQERPLQNEVQKLVASDGTAGGNFGTDVAMDGDTMIIGAEDAAYIFVKTGNTWTEQAKLVGSDSAASDQFGTSVAIDGDTVVIGASSDQIGTNTLQGSAYIFTRSGTTWTQQAKLTADDGANGDTFGNTVAIEGDTVVIAATGDDIGAENGLGSAYVFVRSGSTWSQQAKLVSGDTESTDFIGDAFGGSVSISNNTVVIGAGFDTPFAIEGQGSAHIFVRNGTTWTKQARITASDGAAYDGFGRSSAISGDTIIVTSLSDDIGATPNLNQGSAYIFTRSGTTWTEQTKLTASDGAAEQFFGISVDIDGDRAIVGARSTINGNTFQGSAYLFVRNGAAWTQQEKFIASDGSANDSLGDNVSISGNTFVAGARGDAVNNNSNQGSAYVFNATAVTAATVSVSGRVLYRRSGVSRALVYLTDQSGNTRTTRTDRFGYYRFDEVEAGQTYIFNAYSKRYQFRTQVIEVLENLDNLNFSALR